MALTPASDDVSPLRARYTQTPTHRGGMAFTPASDDVSLYHIKEAG